MADRDGRTFALRVLLIRHGVAEDRAAFARTGESDAVRPLTKSGRRKMRKAARALETLVPRLDAIASSPLTRAVETAEIVRGHFDGVKLTRVPALAPGRSLRTVMEWLEGHAAGRTVALVGHEPSLGELASWSLSGLRESFIPLKKGAACLLEFAEEVKPGRARLLWVMEPRHLRSAAKRART